MHNVLLGLSLAVLTSAGPAAQGAGTAFAVPISADRIVLRVEVDGGPAGTAAQLNGGLIRVAVVAGPHLGLVPVLRGALLEVSVLRLVRTTVGGAESVAELGRVTLSQLSPAVVTAEGLTLTLTWLATRPPAGPLAPLSEGECQSCCITCEGRTLCACEVEMSCGRCCCPQACGCEPVEGRVSAADANGTAAAMRTPQGCARAVSGGPLVPGR
jgi:hypothetical protein